MKKNTRVAIQKRLDQGLTDFAIGEKRYWLKQSCLLSRYRDNIGDFYGNYGPMIEGVVVDGIFDPDNIFTPEEKTYLRQLDHCSGDIDKTISILEASAEDGTLRELLRESNHDYVIDGASRTYVDDA